MHCSKCFTQLDRAQIRQSVMGLLIDLVMDNTYYTLCAQQMHSLLRALSG